MAEEKELARLEGFVSILLEKFNTLRADHKELTERLQQRDTSIVNLQNELASLKDDRSEFSVRVGSLIGQIEEWEFSNALEDEAAESDGDVVAEEEKKDSAEHGNLFNAEDTNV